MTLRSWFLSTPLAMLVVLAVLAAAVPVDAAQRDNGDGTITDSATGLTWVAEAELAARLGLPAWAARAEAIALVRAMNAGEMENFGRTDWRLPTARERASLDPASDGDGPRRIAVGLRTGPGLVEVRPVSGSALVAGVAEATVVAVGSVLLSRGVEVSGDVVANEGAGGSTLASGWEVAIDRDTFVAGDVAGDRVRLDRGVEVTGTVASNQLSAAKATIGPTSSPLALPVFSMLPPFAVSAPRPNAPAVFVGSGDTVELAAEDYQDVTVAGGGTLVLTGGVYSIASLELERGAALLFRAASDVRVRDRVLAGRGVEVGPEAGSGLDGAAAIFYVGGIDGADGVLGSLPRAVEIGAESLFRANLYAADGTVRLHQKTVYEGAIIARDVLVDRLAELTLASYWANRPPVADPQTVHTAGAASIVITLTGSDPEGGDLSFAIVDPPEQGTLSTPVPIVPAPVPPRDGGAPVQPPVTSASVTYTPAGPGDLEDAFSFEVTDPLGSFGSAVVTVNPPGEDEAPPPPPETVVAEDLASTVRKDSSGILGFTAGAPEGVALSYSLIAGTGPANGTLGAIAPGPSTPVRTATADYTPAPGFVGSDGFEFEVCGTVDSVLVCDQAVYSIEVVEPPVEVGELAIDREVTAVADVPLEIDLLSASAQSQSQASSIAGSLRVIGEEAVGIQSAAIGGNVADADGDGFGDNHNALPGTAPVLISAGVDQSGGAGSNGTVRVHVEYDVSGFAGFIDDVDGAQVLLTTRRGTVDSLDTFFWSIGDDGNGTLEASDFERPGEALGITMPVPATQAVGEDGSFSFSVLAALQAAVAAGNDYLTIQGRVDESLSGPARGLQVYSTADGNLTDFKAPALTFSTPPPSIGFLVTITSLPQFGTLFDSSGNAILSVPTTLGDSEVTYVPDPGFVGTDSFSYEVSDSSTTDSGVVTVVVEAATCENSLAHCDDGR